jgi:hypothetical protein
MRSNAEHQDIDDLSNVERGIRFIMDHAVMIWDESLILSEEPGQPLFGQCGWACAALMTVMTFHRAYSESSLQTSKIRTPSIGSGSCITSGSASVRRALS